MAYSAQRRNGACFGSLWKQHASATAAPMNLTSFSEEGAGGGSSSTLSPRAILEGNERAKSHDYCVLIGNTLTSFADVHAFRRGDHPTSEVKIVGASAWNPPTAKSTAGASTRRFAPSDSSAKDPNGTSSLAVGPPTFRLVTFAGTHIYCSAPTLPDRDVWLAALHSGLEAAYASYHETFASITEKPPSKPAAPVNVILPSVASLLGLDLPATSSHILAAASTHGTATLNEATNLNLLDKFLTPPFPKRRTRLPKLRRKNATQSPNTSSHSGLPSSSHGIASYDPYNDTSTSPSRYHCLSCGRYPPEYAMKYTSTPLSQYGMENRVNVCQPCLISQGVLRSTLSMVGLYSSDACERAALVKARDLAVQCVEDAMVVQELERRAWESERLENTGANHRGEGVHADLSNEHDTECFNVNPVEAALSSQDNNTFSSGKSTSSWTNVDSSTERSSSSPPLTLTEDANLIVEREEEDVTDVLSNVASKGESESTLSGDKLFRSWTHVDGKPPLSPSCNSSSQLQAWESVPPAPLATTSLLHLINTPNFATYRRRSRILDLNCRMLESGAMGCAAEFLETLEEHAREATASATALAADCNDELWLKKEAFKVAGDMGAAIKLLHSYALPPKRNNAQKRATAGIGNNVTSSSSVDKGGGGGGGNCGAGDNGRRTATSTNTATASSTTSTTNTEMLACILEFLLDLCEEGELNAVAFFWPQLRQIHLQMLPPTDAGSLVRVELVEDFLLTVSVRYSVHLGLELVWGCIADLEESLAHSNNTATAACRRRRFALLRFVCELESLVFDFDGGWGGGSISLRNMLSPSDHQSALIRDAMCALQLHRRFSSHHLTRSVRLEKLHREAEEQHDSQITVGGSSQPLPLEAPTTSQRWWNRRKQVLYSDKAAAQMKFQIARNADYFSTQIMFTRRLGDIAEKLRFMDVDKRTLALENELQILNFSGSMGGDPLNRVWEDEVEDNVGEGIGVVGGFTIVMHIPCSESHVFRSKERTPILLLMEVVREERIMTNTEADNCRSIFGDDKNKKEGLAATPENVLEQHAEVDIDNPRVIDNLESAPAYNTLDAAQLACHISQGKDELSAFSTTLAPSVPTTPRIMGGKMPVDRASPKPLIGKLKRREGSGRNITTTGETVTVTGILSSPIGKNNPVTPENFAKMENLVANLMQEKLHLPDLLDSPDEEDEHTQNLPNDDSLKDRDSSAQPNVKVAEERERVILSTESGSEPPISVDSNLSPPRNRLERDATRLTASKLRSAATGSVQRKISAFGTIGTSTGGLGEQGDALSTGASNLGADGEGRREVLTTIFVKGMRSNNVIARGAAPAAQRAVQLMDRQRAVQLILDGQSDQVTEKVKSNETDSDSDDDSDYDYSQGNYAQSLAMQTPPVEEKVVMTAPTEEDECMESLRLLLVQNRVASGNLSPENAARTLAHASVDQNAAVVRNKGVLKTATLMADDIADYEPVDAGDVDPRLAGCGKVSHAVLSALKLWQDKVVSNGELLELVQKDMQYTRLALPGAEHENKLMEDSAFWGRFAFGERWAEKKARIQASSQFGWQAEWDLVGVIVKSNDDLRQEAFVMQLIKLCQEAFEMAGLELWLHPYCILATGRTTGIIEMVRNAMSFDSLKKRPGYGTGGLLGHFQRMTEFAADPNESFKSAQKNFVRSLAAYSLLSYLFMFKDRHNGNLLLDTAGHVIHIDFGFVFGTAPGGSFSLEQSAPFKLTEEMIAVMGGLGSSLFSEFVTLFCCGFLALQAHADTFLTIVEITAEGSTFNCFQGKDFNEIVSKLRDRFCPQLDKESTIAFAMDLIKQATTSYGTKQYDYFQYLSNGIAS